VLDDRLAAQAGFRERFLREARVAAALDHPHIVPIYDVGESPLLYLVMPYVRGGNIQQLLRRAPLPLAEVVSYGTQVADALGYAHQHNVIHRDVKPANMLIHADGRILLSDFGLAKVWDGTAPVPVARRRPDAGTPEYMAPEQVRGRTDTRSDLYGLGVVLYLLLTGRLPFTGPSGEAVMAAQVGQMPMPPRLLNAGVTPALDAVVMRALAKRPEDRFQTASQIGAALLAALVMEEATGLNALPAPVVASTGPLPALGEWPSPIRAERRRTSA
jgi:serine/threonine-protein kinase